MTTRELNLELSDGHRIPQLGFGTYKIDNDAAPEIVRRALEIGYRHLDTASFYDNESGVGEGLRRAQLNRDEVFITTKVWQDSHGFDATLRAFDESITALGVEELDLYLIHWPDPTQNKFVETWEALRRLRDEGRIRSIGVANFKEHHLQRLLDETGELPTINQVELHPEFAQPELRAFHREHGICTEAWSPLNRGRNLDHPAITEVAKRQGCTPAQAVLAWHLAIGNVVIPKSADPDRQRENFDAAGIVLTSEDIATIDTCNTGVRTGKDPDTFA
ncbi:aldo/keto reductase [Gulosibacter bifidus]|uniref:Aldo/keto reductase n=1 Tax=Gulosibacter bifidus TaxID=272239 RepID=A0ABW5RHE2_9MICO|nr:aldo/keto reductase [Gulosibacter bifidus]